MVKSTRIRKGMPSVQLSKAEFTERLRGRFYDPAFAEVAEEIERIIEKAWEGYDDAASSIKTAIRKLAEKL